MLLKGRLGPAYCTYMTNERLICTCNIQAKVLLRFVFNKVSVIDEYHLAVVFARPARTTSLKVTLSSTKLSWCTGITVHGTPPAGTVT